jgi:hypothetical protein
VSALASALLAELDDEQLRALAERLRPFLGADESSSDDGWLDGMDTIAAYLGCRRHRLDDPAYRSRTGIPVFKAGRGWAAKKSELDAWRKRQP